MVQPNRLTRFRQAIYDRVLTRRRDAQQELLDALLLSPPVHSFAELSLSPAMARQWSSLYKALSNGAHDDMAHAQVIAEQIPPRLVRVFPLDESAWPRADAATLADRGFVHSATPAIDGRGIVIGHSYSVLAYCADYVSDRTHQQQSSWTLPVSSRRVPTRSDAVTIGAEQVKALCQRCRDKPGLNVVVGDGRYGNHRFVGALAPEVDQGGLGLMARLRSDRVLYRRPDPYGGRGRPRKHGDAFRFKDEATWPAPEAYIAFTDERYGQVELQLWEELHAREDADVEFSVLRAAIHLERSKPPKPLWLLWRGPALPVEDLWGFYRARSSVEASFRFRKQYLAWTKPQVETIAASERWTRLVDLAQWTLYLSRDLVREEPYPWQKPQLRLTPERVKQSLGGLFAQIGTPAAPPKTRGKPPGWPAGRSRAPRNRHPVVRKSTSKAPQASEKATA